MPTLHVLGGANGVGKTTWYLTGVLNNSIIPDLPFINVDVIVLKELGGYNAENILLGEQLARDRMKELIGNARDFMIESNLEINKARVQQRVKEGGHDIATPIIEHRYSMGLSLIKKEIISFSNAILVDVSSDIPKRVSELKAGKIIFKEFN